MYEKLFEAGVEITEEEKKEIYGSKKSKSSRNKAQKNLENKKQKEAVEEAILFQGELLPPAEEEMISLEERKLFLDSLRTEVEVEIEISRLEMIKEMATKAKMMMKEITQEKAKGDANKWIVEGVAVLLKSMQLLNGEPTDIRRNINSPSQMTEEELIKREEELTSKLKKIDENKAKQLEVNTGEVMEIPDREAIDEKDVKRKEMIYRRKTTLFTGEKSNNPRTK